MLFAHTVLYLCFGKCSTLILIGLLTKVNCYSKTGIRIIDFAKVEYIPVLFLFLNKTNYIFERFFLLS